MKRYYLSRRPAQPEGGVWKIFDRVLDIRIASCDFKENAELIVSALNHEQPITSTTNPSQL